MNAMRRFGVNSVMNSSLDAAFVVLVWALSRTLALGAIQATAPGWPSLVTFDGAWYARIAHGGYEYAPDGRQHDVAFFPLYPLVVALLMRLSALPYDVAAPLVSNIAFLGALFVVAAWIRERHDPAAARWCVATLCFLPLSLFASVAYTEGLYLLLTAGALRDFERARYGRAAIWGALAAATRLAGVALSPAFLFSALRMRRSGAAMAAFAVLLGPAAFALYCYAAFGDPLAFIHAEFAWGHTPGVRVADWAYALGFGLGIVHAHRVWLAQAAVVAFVWWWWVRQRKRNLAVDVPLALLVVFAESVLWEERRFLFLLYFVAGPALLVFGRRIGATAVVYGLLSLALIAASGPLISFERYAYGILPLSLALALLWARFPAFGLAVLLVCGGYLVSFARRFAQLLWTG